MPGPEGTIQLRLWVLTLPKSHWLPETDCMARALLDRIPLHTIILPVLGMAAWLMIGKTGVGPLAIGRGDWVLRCSRQIGIRLLCSSIRPAQERCYDQYY